MLESNATNKANGIPGRDLNHGPDDNVSILKANA
jgi:hypothetical protein